MLGKEISNYIRHKILLCDEGFRDVTICYSYCQKKNFAMIRQNSPMHDIHALTVVADGWYMHTHPTASNEISQCGDLGIFVVPIISDSLLHFPLDIIDIIETYISVKKNICTRLWDTRLPT